MNRRLYSIDVGNSSIGVGCSEQGRLSVRRVREPEEAAALIDGESVAISVAPVRLERLQVALRAQGRAPARLLERPPPQLDRSPAELLASAGADRLANALALMPGPGIAVDAGTAVTIDVVDAEGIYRGGFIAAGPLAASTGLATVTARLPRLAGDPVPIVPGLETASALGAGLWGSAVGGVDLLVSRALLALGRSGGVRVVATGGWGSQWAAASAHASIDVVPDLVHLGILRWAERA